MPRVPAWDAELRSRAALRRSPGYVRWWIARGRFRRQTHRVSRCIDHGHRYSRRVHLDGSVESSTDPTNPRFTVSARQTAWGVAATFVLEGIRHIAFGADHLLFVLGLLLIVKDRWMLLKTITAFTVAHSITLAIATLGYADSAGASAQRRHRAEYSFPWAGNRSLLARRNQLTIRHPWVVAFAFGLLHGFGFASALTSAGLPQLSCRSPC